MITLAQMETHGTSRLSDYLPSVTVKTEVRMTIETKLPTTSTEKEIESAVRCTMIEMYQASKRTGSALKLKSLTIKKGVVNGTATH